MAVGSFRFHLLKYIDFNPSSLHILCRFVFLSLQRCSINLIASIVCRLELF